MVVVIKAEGPGLCMMCGAEKETRPYGPGGIEVCFPCGMQDEDEAKRRFDLRFQRDEVDRLPSELRPD